MLHYSNILVYIIFCHIVIRSNIFEQKINVGLANLLWLQRTGHFVRHTCNLGMQAHPED